MHVSRLFPTQVFGRGQSAYAGKILQPASGMDRLSVIYHHPNLNEREEMGHLAVFAEDVMGVGLRNCGFGRIFFTLDS